MEKSLHKGKSVSQQAHTASKQFNMLIDIQAKLAEGKTGGYERWAKKFNRKEAAKTVCLLREKGIGNYEDLVALTDKLTNRHSELSDSIKASEKRLAEIKVLKQHIINYSKTRDVYVQYRKAGYSKKFFEEHREEIQLHKAAKEAFNRNRQILRPLSKKTPLIRGVFCNTLPAASWTKASASPARLP